MANKTPTRNRIWSEKKTPMETVELVCSFAPPMTAVDVAITGQTTSVMRARTPNAEASPQLNSNPPRTGPNNPPMAAMPSNLPDCSPNRVGQRTEAEAKPAVMMVAPEAPCSMRAAASNKKGRPTSSLVATR